MQMSFTAGEDTEALALAASQVYTVNRAVFPRSIPATAMVIFIAKNLVIRVVQPAHGRVASLGRKRGIGITWEKGIIQSIISTARMLTDETGRG